MLEFSESVLKTKKKEEMRMYMLMEYCSGREMFDHVSQKQFDESLARYFFKQLVDVVEYLHLMSIAHLDIKMENIFLDEEYNLKLGDFGHARDTDKNFKKVVGTFEYRAPEQHANKYLTPAALDIF